MLSAYIMLLLLKLRQELPAATPYLGLVDLPLCGMRLGFGLESNSFCSCSASGRTLFSPVGSGDTGH